MRNFEMHPIEVINKTKIKANLMKNDTIIDSKKL
jgi:hypothetical protein